MNQIKFLDFFLSQLFSVPIELDFWAQDDRLDIYVSREVKAMLLGEFTSIFHINMIRSANSSVQNCNCVVCIIVFS